MFAIAKNVFVIPSAARNPLLLATTKGVSQGKLRLARS
jgi:hypothetical protein